MTELPYFPLYVSDYDAATSFLTIEEDGLYMRMLRLCWSTSGCSIPNDKTWLTRRLRINEEQYPICEFLIEEFFEVENGRVFQKRLLKEYEKAGLLKKKRSEAGSKGAKVRALKNKEKDTNKALANGKQSISIPEPEPDLELILLKKVLKERFDEFWNAYDKKVSKGECEKLWCKKVKDEPFADNLILKAKSYTEATPEKKFRMDPARWLRNDRWEDEITPLKTKLSETNDIDWEADKREVF